MKFVIAAVVTLVIAVGGYFSYTKYEQHKFQQSIIPHVKNVSIRLANVVQYETENDSKITYKELFEKLESDVSEIDKRIIEIQTLSTPDNKEVTDSVLAYLKGGQELLRSLLIKYRKQLSLNAANDRMETEMDDLRGANHYGRDYAIKSAQRALKNLQEADKEYTNATYDVFNAAKKMAEVHMKVAQFIRSDALAELGIFEAIAQKNEKKTKDNSKAETK